MERYERSVHIPAPADEVYAWHAREGALERLVPPWESVVVVDRTGPLAEGMRATLEVSTGVGARRWVAEHVAVRPPHGFVDRQLEGPFAAWEHHHRIEPDDGGAWLHDEIDFELPFGPFGALGAGTVRRKLDRMFTYRHDVTVADIVAHQRLRELRTEPMTVAISGASGLLGSALAAFLNTGGHRVKRLVRGEPKSAEEIRFDIPGRRVGDLSGVDVVVHLAGENVGTGRWSADKKERIAESRVRSTALIAEALAGQSDGPRVLISASGVGFYGDSGDAVVDEASPAGSGFLAEVCRKWEGAADPARRAGIRVVHPRIGVVLTPAGGALEKLALPFSLGLGGRQGSGRQWMSWISLDDAIEALAHLAANETIEGPVNFVAPGAVDNATFAETFGRVLHRPAVMPLPRTAAKLALGGERAEELLFTSTRASAQRLEDAGYRFRYPELEPALRHVLGRTEPPRGPR